MKLRLKLVDTTSPQALELLPVEYRVELQREVTTTLFDGETITLRRIENYELESTYHSLHYRL